MNIIEHAQNVFDIEISALNKTRDCLGNQFIEIVNVLSKCNGKVILCGMGKSGHVAKKIAATLSSLGTPSFFLHPAEAKHGDLGMVTADDVVILISYSGESEEVIGILTNLKHIGATIIAISGNAESTLVKNADIAQILPKFDEACHMGLAPSSSTTAVLVYGDALAITCSEIYGFDKNDFGLFHPSGALGKKIITKVCDIMTCGDEIPRIDTSASLMDAIVEMSSKGLGFVNIVSNDLLLKGIFTDGDLRRCLEKHNDIYSLKIQEVMIQNPFSVFGDMLAIEALKNMRSKNINNAPVIDENGFLVGAITIQKIVDSGIIL